MISTRSMVKITVATAIGYVAYRGVLRFMQNNITLTITEMVRLPVSASQGGSDDSTTLCGEIQCETYLTRSYRLSMKLSANIKGGSLTLPSSGRSHHRVVQAADNGICPSLIPPSASKWKEGLPDIVVDDVNPMVDYWELLSYGNVCFTPPCISDEYLLRYEGAIKPEFSPIAFIENCFTQPDDIPGRKSLLFDLVVCDVVHTVSVYIELPNRQCQVVSIDHSRLGNISQPNRNKPHHVRWDIPSIGPSRESGMHGIPHDASFEVSGNVLADLESSTRVRFVLVFEELSREDYNDASANSDIDDDSDLEVAGAEMEGGGDTGAQRGVSTANKKAAKREKRAKMKQKQYQKISLARTTTKGAAGHNVAVSLSYSVSGLVSGMEVRKLRTVSDRPNWVACSGPAYYLMHLLELLYVNKPRLGKFAHYTTWIVQTPDVVSL
uniref:Uncharacterized protein n=1 Tax=Trypanosoma congolense (strain IL3000) TaxID=1068625 RepID=G0UY86_TRYCI|nr:conserved hypothetical protein [Trypanosoma congolense IL3000]